MLADDISALLEHLRDNFINEDDFRSELEKALKSFDTKTINSPSRAS
jgi:hypothetical protein